MFNSPRRWLLVVSPILTLCLLYYLFRAPEARPVMVDSAEPWTHSANSSQQEPPPFENAIEELTKEERCGRLPKDMEDVFVVLKTGATEALDKVPVHLRTTLQCVPHFAVFSDYEETIDGVRTYDILRNVSATAMRMAPEFEIYRRLQEVGREGLTTEEFGDDQNGPFGKINNPGWKLDKWKFLPMIDGALEIQPDAKWYIFFEADSYLVWPNIVNWLARFDHTRPHYLGSPMQIGDNLFGYGGAGIILSNRAMQRLHSYRVRAALDLERMTSEEWAGDAALGRALRDVHVPLTWAWPMMLTSRPWELDHFSEGYGRQPWCYPVISYHHMDRGDIEEMWRFDRAWFGDGKNALLLHGDVYRLVIHNESLSELADWDNLSDHVVDLPAATDPSLPDCADACADNPDCLQYSFDDRERVCKHASTTLYGKASNGTYSGWISRRVQKLLNSFHGSCPQVEYIDF